MKYTISRKIFSKVKTIHYSAFQKNGRISTLTENSQCFLCRFPKSREAFCCYGSHPTGISVHKHHGYPEALPTHQVVPYRACYKSRETAKKKNTGTQQI